MTYPRRLLTGVVPVAASSLAILTLLAFAVSYVAFLHRTSTHATSLSLVGSRTSECIWGARRTLPR
jgi:hypothetical protein